jgi:hypothetical protein
MVKLISSYYSFICHESAPITNKIVSHVITDINKYEFSEYPVYLKILEKILLLEDSL